VAQVLTSGREPRRGAPRRPLPPGLTAAATVLLAAALAVLAVRDGTGRLPTPPAPSARPVDLGPLPPDAVYRLVGDPGPGPRDVRLLVGGAHPGVLDAGTGRLAPLPGLPPAAAYSVDLYPGRGYAVALLTRADSLTRGLLLPSAGGARDLGAVRDVLPRRDGTLLTVTCLAGTGGGCVLASRTATGAVRWQRRVPSEVDLVRDTPYGVVTATPVDAGRWELRLEDPDTGRVADDFGVGGPVLAAGDRLLTWLPDGCWSGCGLLAADLRLGTRLMLPGSAGRPAYGAFSPDGRRLAVGFWGLHRQDPDRSGQRDGYAAVLDLHRAAWTRVPGLTTGAQTAPLPVWTRDGRLLLATGRDGAGRVAAWRPGEPRLTVLPVRLDRFEVRPAAFSLLDG
jgi:hypothetical protein